tara:strand:- start:263 stop:445 length:183 start_codon:yes stop_codon:yes gene_type:complete
MSNTIEDLIREIIYYEFEEKEDQLVEMVREGINLELPDYDIVDAFNKLERRIKVLEEKIK